MLDAVRVTTGVRMSKKVRFLMVSAVVVALIVSAGVYHDLSADAEARSMQDRIVEEYGKSVDACDQAYGQGRLVKPPSLAEEGFHKYQASVNANVQRKGDHILVILQQGVKACRLDSETYEVLEKL